jgi:hypothetical protein
VGCDRELGARALSAVSFPRIEADPYGKDMRLQRCHVGKPLTPTTEDRAASDFTPGHAAWSLLTKIAVMPSFVVEHGDGESIICYRGFRIGGIDRKKGHWFVSKTLGTYAVDRFLRAMGFTLDPGMFGSARQSWYALDAAHSTEFEHTVRELSRAIDVQVKPST